MEGYKERFKVEYQELKEKQRKLNNLLNKHEVGMLGFRLTCPVELLYRQNSIMKEYLHVLELRAVIENVDLEDKGEPNEKDTLNN